MVPSQENSPQNSPARMASDTSLPPPTTQMCWRVCRGGGQQAAEDWRFPCSLPRGNPLFQAELGLNHPYSATSGVMVSSRAS